MGNSPFLYQNSENQQGKNLEHKLKTDADIRNGGLFFSIALELFLFIVKNLISIVFGENGILNARKYK